MKAISVLCWIKSMIKMSIFVCWSHEKWRKKPFWKFEGGKKILSFPKNFNCMHILLSVELNWQTSRSMAVKRELCSLISLCLNLFGIYEWQLENLMTADCAVVLHAPVFWIFNVKLRANKSIYMIENYHRLLGPFFFLLED